MVSGRDPTDDELLQALRREPEAVGRALRPLRLPPRSLSRATRCSRGCCARRDARDVRPADRSRPPSPAELGRHDLALARRERPQSASRLATARRRRGEGPTSARSSDLDRDHGSSRPGRGGSARRGIEQRAQAPQPRPADCRYRPRVSRTATTPRSPARPARARRPCAAGSLADCERCRPSSKEATREHRRRTHRLSRRTDQRSSALAEGTCSSAASHRACDERAGRCRDHRRHRDRSDRLAGRIAGTEERQVRLWVLRPAARL